MQRGVHQFRPVVIRNNLEAVRDGAIAVNFRNALFDSANNFLGIAAGEHHDNATHRFGIAALYHRTVANFLTEFHFSHVANIDWRAVHFFQDDGANIIEIADEADAADQILLGVLRKDAATRIAVIARERIEDFFYGQSVVVQLDRIDNGLILLDVAAGGIDLGHARNRAQQRTHDPVLYGAPL